MGSLLGILLTGAVGIATYAWQENIRRKAALAEQRLKLYDTLVRSIVELLGVSSGAERSRLITEIEKCWLFASDEVLAACYGYLDAYDRCWNEKPGNMADWMQQAAVREEFGALISNIFLAMRNDLRKTGISRQWAEENLRLYSWGIMAQMAQDRPASAVGAASPQ